MRKVNQIVIHCTATPIDVDYTFERLIADHKARGFQTCGYHRYIRKDGTIYVGRHFDKVGAHAGKGFNANSIGISYEGGIIAGGNANNPKHAKDTRTDAQKKAILQIIDEILDDYDITSIVGHRDLSPDLDGDGIVEPHEWIKMCPCFDAIPEFKHLLK